MTTSNDTTKRCKKCGGVFPSTTEYFYSHSGCKGGLRPDCKSCVNQAGKLRREQNPEATKERSRKYYIAHKPEILEKTKQYTKGHPEQRKAASRRSYRKRREKVLKSQRDYRNGSNRHRRLAAQRKYEHNNKERVKEIKKRYERENPEKIKAHKHSYYVRNKKRYYEYRRNRIALLINAEGTFDMADVRAMHKRQRGKCYYCHAELSKYHVDHVIPLSRGGSNDPSNLVLACPQCNNKKGAKLPHEWPEGGRLL